MRNCRRKGALWLPARRLLRSIVYREFDFLLNSWGIKEHSNGENFTRVIDTERKQPSNSKQFVMCSKSWEGNISLNNKEMIKWYFNKKVDRFVNHATIAYNYRVNTKDMLARNGCRKMQLFVHYGTYFSWILLSPTYFSSISDIIWRLALYLHFCSSAEISCEDQNWMGV